MRNGDKYDPSNPLAGVNGPGELDLTRTLRIRPGPIVRLLAWLLRPVVTWAIRQGAVIDAGHITDAQEIAAGRRPNAYQIDVVVPRFPELRKKLTARGERSPR